MMRRVLALALLLPSCLLACSSATGDIPGPGCTSIQTTTEVSFPAAMAPGSADTTVCLGRAPTVSAKAEAECIALLGTRNAGTCSCPVDQGLQDVTAAHKNAVGKFFDTTRGTSVAAGCVCEIKQLTADDAAGLAACTKDAISPLLDSNHQAVNGYCYVDPGKNTSANPELVKDCAAGEKRAMRVVGSPAAQRPDDISVVIICSSEECSLPGE